MSFLKFAHAIFQSVVCRYLNELGFNLSVLFRDSKVVYSWRLIHQMCTKENF